MGENIKKNTASNIYHGVDKETGELKHISEVRRGQKCNCTCVRCGQMLKARKGEQRRHHFAHVSNYDCMYAGEIGVYLMFRELLQSIGYIYLPQIRLKFPAWKNAEILRESRKLAVESVQYECEEYAYPPLLKVSAAGAEFRIILDFGRYYDELDRAKLEGEAREEGHSLLMFDFPKLNDEDFSKETLAKEVKEGGSAYWLYSRLAEEKKASFYAIAREPEKNGRKYKCPISVGGKFGADSRRDCGECQFNVSNSLKCMCTAFEGVCSTKDFGKSQAIRLVEMETLRRENEKTYVQWMPKEPIVPAAPITNRERQAFPSDAELEEAFLDAKKRFDINALDGNNDRFGNRLIQCEDCGEIKLAIEMARYGGKGIHINLGLCSKCLRMRNRVQ